MTPLDPNSRDVLRAGRAAEGPTAADRERVRRKVAVALAAGATGPALAAPAVGAAKWWASRAVLGSVGVVSAVVVSVSAVVVTRQRAVVEHPTQSASPGAPAPPSPAEGTSEHDELTEPELPEAPLSEPSPPAPEPRGPTKQVKRTKRPRAATPPVESPPAPAPAAGSSAALPARASADELEAETQALREVQLALHAKEPRRALALLDEQDLRFSSGQLRQEREGARVLALCATDPAAGALALERFQTAHATSPLLARLKAACSR